MDNLEDAGQLRPASPPESSTTPRKRQKQDTPMEVPSARKGKACSICRKVKVKCESSQQSSSSCSRCLRLGLRCVYEKRSWIPAETGDEPQQQSFHAVIFKLERALEDVLEKLSMPALDLYAQPAIVEPLQPPRPTRQNSQEPLPGSAKRGERDVSPGPMTSLIEATRLNGLTSQLRSGKQRRKGGMRRMDSDLISENIITFETAEEMLELFKSLLSHHLFSASIAPDVTLENVRTSSTVLFTAIMMVSALHIPGQEDLHEACHGRFLGLVSSFMFDRFHTLDDIRGLCIAAFWQPDLSWKLSGLCIRMATELNLHHAFYESFYTDHPSEEVRRESLEKTRLWYLLFILDHQSSIAYGRPPVMAELRPIKDYEVLLKSPWCTAQDRAMIAQVTGFVILSKAFETFGFEPKRTMGSDDASVMTHYRFTEDAVAWKERWEYLEPLDTINRSDVQLHYCFGQLVLNSLVLRGRPLDTLQDLPPSLRPLTLRAVEAAQTLLQHFVEQPEYRERIVGMPLYLHSMIAFAVVFLMKMSHRWHAIGITIDPERQTRPLIEGIISLLRGCKAGANHMVFSMANGFERMLRQASRQATSRQGLVNNYSTQHTAERPHWSGHPSTAPSGSEWMNSNQREAIGTPLPSFSMNQQATAFDANEPPKTNYSNPIQAASEISPYDNWDFQDETLWSIGMGYDLLAPGEGALAEMDFLSGM